ncbi:unnamed protein product [Blepharisma stoltei]|uniref:Uncharacterized protein n=1 Tax=Blepharisma stoltei TaxID=1481888 RepID=A0AAU9K274_9CILI|nr:unnamed protein product [Blepharisma stoltei]
MERFSLQTKNSIKEDNNDEPEEYYIIPRSSYLNNADKYDNSRYKPSISENFLESPSKSVSSNHYLEKRFRPYLRASRHVTAVRNHFDLQSNSFFDRAKEDQKSFLQKSPSKDCNFHVSRLPEIPVTKELEIKCKIVHSFRNLYSANRKIRDSPNKDAGKSHRISNSISYIKGAPYKYCNGNCGNSCFCQDRSFVHVRHNSGGLKMVEKNDAKGVHQLREMYLDPVKFSRNSLSLINKVK